MSSSSHKPSFHRIYFVCNEFIVPMYCYEAMVMSLYYDEFCDLIHI